MTIAEMKKSTKTVLTPGDVCEVLSCGRYAINQQAHADPSKLGFPVIITGRRVKIPREAFIRYFEGIPVNTGG